jgi:hypothetical protein
MKSLKGLEIHGGGDVEAFVRYALSLPISVLTIGFRRIEDVEQDLDIALRFRPMDEDDMAALAETTRGWADADVLWWKRR